MGATATGTTATLAAPTRCTSTFRGDGSNTRRATGREVVELRPKEGREDGEVRSQEVRDRTLSGLQSVHCRGGGNNQNTTSYHGLTLCQRW